MSVCVRACVWLVDPLHVGPPAPGLLTHIIKGKGLLLLFQVTKMKGTLSSVSSVSLCSDLAPPFCTYSSAVVGGLWDFECALCLRDIVSFLTKSVQSEQDFNPSVWGLHAKTAMIRCVSPASTPTESTCLQPTLTPVCLHSAAQYGFSYNSA